MHEWGFPGMNVLEIIVFYVRANRASFVVTLAVFMSTALCVSDGACSVRCKMAPLF